MPLVPAKCPSCGGEIQVDNSRKEAFCSYCGTKFLVESAVTYYNTKNEYHIEHADIKMEDSSGIERQLKAAESNLKKLKNYSEARKRFEQITDEFPDDWRGWWGVVRAETHDFTGVQFALRLVKGDVIDYSKGTEQFRADFDYEVFYGTKMYVNNALKVMDPSIRDEHKKEWDTYIANIGPAWERFKAAKFLVFEQFKPTYLEREKRIKQLEKRSAHYYKTYKKNKYGVKRALFGNSAKQEFETLDEEIRKLRREFPDPDYSCDFYDFEHGEMKYVYDPKNGKDGLEYVNNV